jgi:hypothetical protein
MWLGSTLPFVAAGLAAAVAWRRATRGLHRRALYEPWHVETSGEDHRRGVFSRRKRHRWNVTVVSALAGSISAAVLLHFIHVAQTVHGG